MDAITVESLTKRYGKRLGVDAISLRVAPGAIYGFLGPNGAGKTTTIRVLMGLLRATSGRATVFGRDCWADTDRIKREVGYLPGDLRLYAWMTARDAFAVLGEVRGADLVAEGLRIADEFGLDTTVAVRKMSRGMRQKLGIILAIVHQPRLLILDEPTASLDPLMQEKLYGELRRFAAEGATVFLSSHTLSEVERLCDRVAILREGRVVAEDSIHALRAQAARQVRIHWRDEVPLSATHDAPFRVTSASGATWSGTIDGATAELIAWAASKPIDDMTIGEPDLTEVFHSFYR